MEDVSQSRWYCHRGLGDLEGMKLDAAALRVADGDSSSPGEPSVDYLCRHLSLDLASWDIPLFSLEPHITKPENFVKRPRA